MNNEIREILDNFKNYEERYKLHNETQFIIMYREIQILLDYITNLQGEKEDYKSRCENAYEELTYMSSSDYVEDYDIKQNCWIKLSNILQNGSDASVKD